MKTRLISYPLDYAGHVSQDTVREFEKIVLQDKAKQEFAGKFSLWLGKGAARLGAMRFLEPVKIMRTFKNQHHHNFCIFMGHEFKKALFPFLVNQNNSAYFFDAWPKSHKRVEAFIKATDLSNVFFSSKHVTQIFKAKNLDCNFDWIPEGIDPDSYRFKTYEEKDIDVLAFGRRYDALHNKIEKGLLAGGINYLFEKNKGEIIFPDRTAFIEGLSRTKISVCIPNNITNPQLTGNISTMTVRYLQSMISKTLIVGIMPEEMKDLFDYSPIIGVNMENPLSQIKEILANYSRYIPLIEKNYEEVKRRHSWENRWRIIKSVINNKG